MAANCFINYMLDYRGIQEKVEIEECEVCGNKAKFHCVECNNFLCNLCKVIHEKRPSSDPHQFCTISQKNLRNWEHRNSNDTFCAEHRYSPISSYCKSCQTPVCEECYKAHQEHIIITVDDAFQQYKNAAETLVMCGLKEEESAKEKLSTLEATNKQWVASTITCEKEIVAYVDRLQKQLDCARDRLLESMNEVSTKKEKQLEEEIKKLRSIEANVKNARLRNEGLMGTLNPTGALFMINDGLIQLETILENLPQLYPINVGNLEFDPDRECLEGFKLGSVYEGGLLDQSKCKIDIASEKIEKTVGQIIEFKLTTNDSNGKKKPVISDSISVVLQNDSGDRIHGEVKEISKGVFQITCLCKWETECKLCVDIFGQPISGSPFKVIGLRHQLLLKTIDTGNYWTKKKSNIDDVCFTTDDKLLACSSTNQILKFDLEGNYINTVFLEEKKEIQGVFCIDFDLIAVTEKTGSEVLICKQDGAIVRQFGKGSLQNPKGIAVSIRRNEVFVVDCHAHCVFRFSNEGRLLSKIGGFGSGNGQLNTPHSIAVMDADDQLIVSDSLNHRLQVFKFDGKFIRSIGYGRGHGNGKMEFPRAVALDGKGHIIVGSSDRLQFFDLETGQFVTRLDHRSDDVISPYGIAVGGGRIAVANWRGLGSKSANIKIFKDAFEDSLNDKN